MKKWFDNLHPIAQIALVVVGMGLLIKAAKTYGPKVPVVGGLIVQAANFIA